MSGFFILADYDKILRLFLFFDFLVAENQNIMENSMSTIQLEAKPRYVGKGASRRLRKEEKVPAIIYGNHLTPVAVELMHRHVINLSRDKELSSKVISLQVGENNYQAIVKNLERHVYKNKVMHIEFQAINANEMISVDVSLQFLNADRCVGVKKGGALSLYLRSIKVRCLPSKLPSSIEVDLSSLDVDQILHISSLTLPEGVESYDLMLGKDHDLAVASVQAVKE